MPKKLQVFFISFVISVLGSFQMYWFLPSGISCLNPNESILDAIFIFMPFQFIVVSILLIFTKNRIQFYSLMSFLFVFWFLINMHEFTYRHACWSTFSNTEIVYYTIYYSLIPIPLCLSVFGLGYYLLTKNNLQR